MWIVRLALRRPYTFVVMAIVIILLMPLTVLRTPVDIFPDINIPVVSVVWTFTGFAPQEMADRIVSNSERISTVTVNNIEHIESQSVNGVGVVKIFFQPQVNIQTVYASKYTSNKAKGSVIWKPVPGVGNALVGGSWKITDNKTSTALELKIEGE